MRRLASAVVVIALASAGCIGSSSSSTPTERSTHSSLVPPSADLTITYIVPTCPPGVSCIAASTTQHYFIVSRHLTCSPDGGDYTLPAAVCHALADLVTKYDTVTPAYLCPCLKAHNPPKAVGLYDGKRRSIPLDGCSLCGLHGIGGDVKLARAAGHVAAPNRRPGVAPVWSRPPLTRC
jgi:hypothetical protein